MPTKKDINRPSGAKKTNHKNKVSFYTDKKRYMVVAKRKNYRNLVFECEACSFRDILIQVGALLNTSLSSKDSDYELFCETINNFTKGSQAKSCLALFKKFFGVEIVFLGELGKIHYRKTDVKNMESDDELPF